jgi:hypothetical protein
MSPVVEALPPLPARFGPTRDSLRALACYVVAPACKARTGHIGLRPVGGGFGTPPLDDGSRIVVRGDQLGWEAGESITITDLRGAAGFLDLGLSADPGVGHDLPPFVPDVDLAVDGEASLALGAWYALGQQVLDGLRDGLSGATMSEAQLWPEHFDLAVTVHLESGAGVNIGFSPGDGFDAGPYAYVGPHATADLSDPYWNAPFGASLGYRSLTMTHDPAEAALAFILDGLVRLGSSRSGAGGAHRGT